MPRSRASSTAARRRRPGRRPRCRRRRRAWRRDPPAPWRGHRPRARGSRLRPDVGAAAAVEPPARARAWRGGDLEPRAGLGRQVGDDPGAEMTLRRDPAVAAGRSPVRRRRPRARTSPLDADTAAPTLARARVGGDIAEAFLRDAVDEPLVDVGELGQRRRDRRRSTSTPRPRRPSARSARACAMPGVGEARRVDVDQQRAERPDIPAHRRRQPSNVRRRGRPRPARRQRRPRSRPRSVVATSSCTGPSWSVAAMRRRSTSDASTACCSRAARSLSSRRARLSSRQTIGAVSTTSSSSVLTVTPANPRQRSPERAATGSYGAYISKSSCRPSGVQTGR